MMLPSDPIIVAQVASLQAERAALISAIASGARSASYDGKSVTYDDFDKMKMRVNFIDAQISGLIQPGYRKPQAGFATFTRGR